LVERFSALCGTRWFINCPSEPSEKETATEVQKTTIKLIKSRNSLAVSENVVSTYVKACFEGEGKNFELS
jgi:hypothetical protein